MKNILLVSVIGLCCSLLMIPYPLRASSEARMIVKITVIAPSCKINDNQPVTVDFKDVFTIRVDGDYQKQLIDYSFKCNAIGDTTFNLKILGENADFGNGLLKTSNDDLGIQILADGNKLAVNSPLPLSWPQQKPRLEAVLVKRDSINLTAGEFTAGAVFKIEYN